MSENINLETEKVAYNEVTELKDEVKEQENAHLQKIYKEYISGVSWFYWIAGLSLVNTIIFILGSDTSFVVGLGITQIIDVFIYYTQGAGKIALFAIDLIPPALFALFAYLGNKGKKVPIIIGIILYLLDTALLVYLADYSSVAFHLFALFFIGKALLNHKKLSQAEIF